MNEEHPAEVSERVGTLESKINNVSSLISRYRELKEQNDNPLYPWLQEDMLQFSQELFKEIIESIGKTIHRQSLIGQNYYRIISLFDMPYLETDSSGHIIFTAGNCNCLFQNNKKEETGVIFDYVQSEYEDLLKSKIYEREENGPVLIQCISTEGQLMAAEVFSQKVTIDSKVIYALIIRDLSVKNDLKTRLQKVESDYNALSETVNEVILRIDEKLNILYSNSAIKAIFGYSRDEVLDKNLSMLFPPEILDRYKNMIEKLFNGDNLSDNRTDREKTIEILGLHKNRGISPMEISFGNVKKTGNISLTCIIRDISRRKYAERKLHKLAYFDKLTNLGNRDLFAKDMEEHLKKINQKYEPGSLMFLDLDGFKNINDTLGHSAGDSLLVETAKRLHDCLRESDSVYRLGGDEFLVLLRRIRERKDAAIVAKNILNTVRMPFYLKRNNKSTAMVNVGVSIGIVILDEENVEISDLTKKADLAMYASKNSGKNRYTFYTEEMVQSINERWELEQGLKTALARNELELHYQPIVNSSGEICGVESLLRWFHPVMGYIPPDKFIPIAEETNMIIPIGAWIIEKSCREIEKWNNNGFPDLYISVNISTKQFDQTDIVETIGSVIRRTGCNPANLKLELTETGIMEAPEKTIEKMKLLKEKIPAIQIMIDDFGTGYSSLNYLANLPADLLKIDLSFVSKLDNSNNRKVVNSIINLAEALEMGFIAEGIETEKELEYFREKRCDRMQGYYFSKAVKSNDVPALLEAGKLPLKK